MKLIRLILFLKLRIKYGVIIKSSDVSARAKLGKKVLIERGVSVDRFTSIGDFSYVNQNSRLESVAIGRFCSIAAGVVIGPYEHTTQSISTHPFSREPFYGFSSHKKSRSISREANEHSVKIGDDVWIGVNAIVLRGVSIGNGSVIAAGAVVTKNVPCYEIWGGVPAKKIRDRFPREVKDILVRSCWTNRPDSWIAGNIIPNFDNPLALKKLIYDELKNELCETKNSDC